MKFDTWFVKQNGKRLSDEPTHILYSNLTEAADRYNEAKRLYELCVQWDEKKTIAWYAWNTEAKDKK